MDITRVDPDDEGAVRACYAVFAAAQAVDDPELPPMSYPAFAALTRIGWAGDPRETWLTGDGAGYLTLELPSYENRHQAGFELTVHPERRSQGTGTGLVSFTTERCRELGRSAITTDAWTGSPGDEFLRRYGGFKAGLSEVRRVLRVGAVPGVALAAGYSLVSWSGAMPAERLDQVARIMEMLGDAPRDASREPERWDAERVRRTDQRIAAQGLRYYTVIAEGTDGDIAALTQLGVDPLLPDWCWQELTAVARAHRGHGLGLAVKSAMLRKLATAEPRLKRVLTWNAEQNKHMIAINEALGYEVFGVPARSWEREVG